MSRSTRVAVAFLVVLTLAFGSTVTFAAVTVARAGVIDVSVVSHEPGAESVSFLLPGVLVTIAALVLPYALPDDAAREIGPHAPALRAAADALAQCPDAVFVEVESQDEHVRIAKEGRYLTIDVESTDEDVHIRLPIRAVRSLARALDRASARA